MTMWLRYLSRVSGQIGVFVAFFLAWEVLVDILKIKPVILPAPSVIFLTIGKHWAYLMQHTWPTFLAIGGGYSCLPRSPDLSSRSGSPTPAGSAS